MGTNRCGESEGVTKEHVYGCLIIGILLFVGTCLWGAWHIVPPGHRGVAVTLGKVQTLVRGEGFTLKFPWLTSIEDIPIKQITVAGKASSFSSDLQTVIVDYNVLYRIPEGRVVELFQQYSGDAYTTLVDPRIQEIIKQNAASYKAEDLVKNREKIKTAVLHQVQEVMKGTKEGESDLVHVVDVVITNIDLTDELEKAIEAKQVMEQSALAKNYELQKETKEAEITIVKAKAEAEAVKIKGEALKSSPEVIQLEIAKKWDGKAPLAVSTMAGGANILLPMK